MLKRLALLLLANALLFAWGQGWLAGVVGIGPDSDREPQRIAAQIAPESIQVVPLQTLTRRVPPSACLEVGPLSPAELAPAETALRGAVGEGGWTLLTRERPGAWIVYLGPYNSRERMQRRADDLRRQELAFEEIHTVPELEPGFSFGRHSSEADAQEALRRLQAQKLRSARVVRLEAPSTSHTLRVPKADADAQQRLSALGDLARGKRMQACGKDARG